MFCLLSLSVQKWNHRLEREAVYFANRGKKDGRQCTHGTVFVSFFSLFIKATCLKRTMFREIMSLLLLSSFNFK